MVEQDTDWEQIFTNLIYNKRLLSRIYKNSHNSIVKTTNQAYKRCPSSFAKKFKSIP